MSEVLAGIFLALFALIITVAAFKLYKSKLLHSGSKDTLEPPLSDKLINMGKSVTHCQSPDCYRCTNNYATLQRALTKLSYCANGSGMMGNAGDVNNISADIRKSIDRLKNPDKYTEETQVSSPAVFKMSGLREELLWSLNDFPALQVLETHFRQIQLEFFHLYKSPLPETTSLWKTNSTGSGKWEIAQLYDQGRKTKAAELCPLTVEVLKKIPYFIDGNIFGDASFSVVHSNTVIATHCGTTNCRIRCHLGLKVPEDECILVVGDKTCRWQEGKIVCFNDAFPHSVEHRGPPGSDPRVVFILDLWHPDVDSSQKDVLNYAFSV